METSIQVISSKGTANFTFGPNHTIDWLLLQATNQFSTTGLYEPFVQARIDNGQFLRKDTLLIHVARKYPVILLLLLPETTNLPPIARSFINKIPSPNTSSPNISQEISGAGIALGVLNTDLQNYYKQHQDRFEFNNISPGSHRSLRSRFGNDLNVLSPTLSEGELAQVPIPKIDDDEFDSNNMLQYEREYDFHGCILPRKVGPPRTQQYDNVIEELKAVLNIKKPIQEYSNDLFIDVANAIKDTEMVLEKSQNTMILDYDLIICITCDEGLELALSMLKTLYLPLGMELSVCEDFEPGSEDEIQLTEGDRVQAYRHLYDGWVLGRNKTTNKEGLFPLTVTLPQCNTRYVLINTCSTLDDVFGDEYMAGSLLAYPEDIEITHCIPSESVTETMDIGTILPTSITARLLHDLIGDIWDLEDPEAQQVVMVSGSPAFQAANFKLLTKIGIECENILLLPQTPIDFNYGTAGLGKSSTKLNQETNDQVMISQPSLKVDIVVDPFEDENELSLSPIGFTRTKAIKRSSRYFDEIPSATVTATLDPNDTYIEGGSLVCSPIETGKTIKRKATPDVTSDQRDVDIPQQIIPHIPDGPAVVESRSIQDKPSLMEDGLGDLTNEMGHTQSKPSFMEDDLDDLMNEMGHTASKPSFMEDDLDDLMNEMGIQPTVRAPFPALSTFTEPPRFGLTMFKRGAENIQSSEPPESPKTEVKVEPEPIESKAIPIDELAEFLQWKEQD